jgi:hypothetical protein
MPPDAPPCDPALEPDWPPCAPPEGVDEPEELPEDPLLEAAPPDDDGMDAPEEPPLDPELPEGMLLPPDEEEDDDELDEAPPLLPLLPLLEGEEEDCWLTQPPTRNAETVPTSVPCAASTRMRWMARFIGRSDV